MDLKLFNSKFQFIENENTVVSKNSNKTALILSNGGKDRGYIKNLTDKFGVNFKDNLTYFVNSYPSLEDIKNLYDDLSNKGINSIFAIGGGSVIDSAKSVSALLSLESVEDILEVINFPEILSKTKKQKIQLIVLPTTAGTGAEVTQFATIWDKKQNKKYSLDHPSLIPDAVYFLPQLLHTHNLDVQLFPALDCFSHSLESLWNKNRTKESTVYSKLSLENSFLNDFDSFKNIKDNINYSLNLSKSSFYAGKAINITRTSIAHAISYPLTLIHNVPHGLACSFTLPAIFELVEEEISQDLELLTIVKQNIDELKMLNLNQKINKYLDLNSALYLLDEMKTRSRTENFLKKLNHNDYIEILNKSF